MENEIGPITHELITAAKKSLLYFSYGEFDGFRDPLLADLYALRGLLDGAIAEKVEESRHERKN